MKNKDIKQVIEEAQDHVAGQMEAERSAHADAMHEFGLGFCYGQINLWKRSYCRKNSRKPVSILLRTESELVAGDWHYKHHIALFVDGERKEWNYIRAEAFDTLTRGLTSDVTGRLETFVYYRFTPVK